MKRLPCGPCAPIALALLIATPLPASAPQVPGASSATLNAPGLSAPASIARDRWGIPHVRAASLPDLYFAWGYATGQDRLWQLAYTRAQGQGLVHRWLGNESLEDDGGAQLFRLRERADSIWARDRLDPALRLAVERYSAGINAALEQRFATGAPRARRDEFDRLGIRPAPWRPADCVLLLLGLGVTLDLDLPEFAEGRAIREHGAAWLDRRTRFEGEQRFATIPAGARGATGVPGIAAGARDEQPARGSAAASTAAAFAGAQAARAAAPEAPAWWARAGAEDDREGSSRASNAFVVGPARCARGLPILANDPHLSLTEPGPFHVVHLVVPGVLDASGACVPGLPAIVSGRNDRCAWGVTALSADVIDVYADTLSADGRSVRAGRSWTPIRTAPFDLRYRVLGVGLPVPSFVQQRRYTPHGPVLVWDPRRHIAYSARWSALEDSGITLSRMVGLERSRTADEVAERYRTLVTPTINLLAADVQGTALYQAVGRVPVRPFAFTRGPLPADGRHEWACFIPPDSMPAWHVPAGGFAVNGNNLPAAGLPWSRYDWLHDRAARLAERLAGDRSVTLADAASVQNDVLSRLAARATPWLLACADSLRGRLGARERQATDSLRGWDDVTRRGRVAPLLLRAWWTTLQRRSRTTGLPGLTLAGLQGRAPDAFRRPGSESPERPAEAAIGALSMALDTLAARLGPDLAGWSWGRAHRARFRHPLARLPGGPGWEPPLVPVDGDGSTVAVAGSSPPFDLEVHHGPAFRHVVDLSIPESSLAVLPPWNSERDRVSLLRDWARHGYVPLLRDSARIAAETRSVYRLVPAGRPAR